MSYSGVAKEDLSIPRVESFGLECFSVICNLCILYYSTAT